MRISALLPIVWQDNARLGVREAIAYIAERDEQAALALEAALHHSIGRLASFPQIGRPGRVEGTRELILQPNYLIVYRVTDSAVDIVNFLHARRRYP